jgi:putative ABC transport system permease protein
MAWYHRFLNAARSDRLSKDIDRELSFHIAERADDLKAGGMPAEEAKREARRRFGNRAAMRERSRDADLFAWFSSTLVDIRYATRALVASPGFSIVAILSLAFGIGANTAIFSLTNALLLKSLPVSHPEELVHVYMDTVTNTGFTYPLWEQIERQTAAYARSVAHATSTFNLASGGQERRVLGAWVSGSLFPVLGVQSVAGRLFSPADDQRGCPGTAVVSEGFAAREYGGAAQAVGKLLSLNGHPFEVIGVSDGRFFGLEAGRTSAVFAPLCAQAILLSPKILDARTRWYIDIVLRPNAGVSRAQINAQLAGISAGVFAATLPSNVSSGDQRDYLKVKLGSEPAGTGLSDLRGRYRLALYTLMAIVAIVLLVACANIANLLLARAAARSREIAIRMAMGAGRGRLVRQLLTESALLAVAGAAAGIGFAQWASRLIVRFLSTAGRPVFLDLSLDGRMLGFTIAVAAATVMIFGLVPAWRATRVDPQSAMKTGGRGVVGGDTRHRLGRSLVVAQVALSLALVAGSGLLLGSFRKLLTLDPGFKRDGVTVVTMKFHNANYKPDALLGAKRDVLTRLRALPGVSSASASMLTPISNAAWNEIVAVPGYSPGKQADSIAFMNQVSTDYFGTLGTAIVAGRDVSERDIDQRRSVALINETMARHFFGASSPLGRTFQVADGDTLKAPVEVIGVVRDAKYQRLDEKTLPTAYVPLGEGDTEGSEMQFEIRSGASLATLVPAVRAIAAGINPAITLDVTTLEDQVSASLARPRLLATLSAFFGGLALLLAVIGLYGTMSYSVNRRRNEIGIRIALGAAKSQVMRMIAGEAAVLIVFGIALGGALAVAATRLVRTLLFGLTPTDPATFAYSALALGVVAMAAALIPAVPASREDPMSALRGE